MKRLIFTLFALMCTTVMAWAQTPTSVTIFSEQGERFWVILDGAKQNALPNTRVKLNGLNPTVRYHVKIIFQDEKLAAIDDNIYTTGAEGPQDLSYMVRMKKGRYVLHLNSWSAPAGNTADAGGGETVTYGATGGNSSNSMNNSNASNSNAVNTNSTNTTTTNTNMNTSTGMGGAGINMSTNGMNTNVTITDPNGNQANMNMGMNTDPNGNMNVNMNANDPNSAQRVHMRGGSTTTTTTTTSTTTTTTTTRGGMHRPQNMNNNNPNASTPASTQAAAPVTSSGCSMPMSMADFEKCKNSIRNQKFSEEQMKVAKQILKSKCISADQVKEVMGLFSFENDKLTFAKYAYDYTVDKDNYFTINDALGYSSSVDELNSYIESKGK